MSLDRVYRLFCDGYKLRYHTGLGELTDCVGFSDNGSTAKEARAVAVKAGWTRRNLETKYVNTFSEHSTNDKIDLCPRCTATYEGIAEISIDVAAQTAEAERRRAGRTQAVAS